MRIAIPVVNQKLSQHFGHSEKFYFFDIEDKKIVKTDILNPPPHAVGTIPRWVAENNATDLIAGGIGQKAITIFNQSGVNVHVGALIESPEKIVSDFTNGNIILNSNMCDH